MRGLFFLLFIVFISCSGSTYNCGEIDRKYEKDGEYFFALDLGSTGSGANDDGGRIYSDVSVDKTTYLLKKVGDEYCSEE